MTIWAKIDTNIFANPKISGLNKDCKLAYIASILAAREVEKEGVFSLQLVTGMTGFVKKNAPLLVAAGLWEPVEYAGCYRVHDYRENGLSAQDRARLAEVSRANGAKGGRPRKNPKPGNPDENPSGLTKITQSVTQTETQSITQSVNPDVTQKNPLNRAEQSRLITPPSFKPPQNPKNPVDEKTSLSDGWEPSTRAVALANKNGVDLDAAVEFFRNWAIAGGKKSADWERTFTNALNTWLKDKFPSPGMDEGMTRQAELERNAAELKAAYKRLNQQSEGSAFTEPPF